MIGDFACWSAEGPYQTFEIIARMDHMGRRRVLVHASIVANDETPPELGGPTSFHASMHISPEQVEGLRDMLDELLEERG